MLSEASGAGDDEASTPPGTATNAIAHGLVVDAGDNEASTPGTATNISAHGLADTGSVATSCKSSPPVEIPAGAPAGVAGDAPRRSNNDEVAVTCVPHVALAPSQGKRHPLSQLLPQVSPRRPSTHLCMWYIWDSLEEEYLRLDEAQEHLLDTVMESLRHHRRIDRALWEGSTADPAVSFGAVALCVPLSSDVARRCQDDMMGVDGGRLVCKSVTSAHNAGQVLQACEAMINGLRDRLTPAIFKIGITSSLLRRFDMYRSEPRPAYQLMYVLHFAQDPMVSAMLEAALIRIFKGKSGCHNERPGGEGIDMHARPWCATYVMFGKAGDSGWLAPPRPTSPQAQGE